MGRSADEILHDISVKHKTCTSCHQRKHFNAFHRQESSPDGRASYCIECKTAARRSHHLKHCYDLTEEKYLEMIDEQRGACAICGSDDETISQHLNVDHDHETGDVRGLLCSNCNKGLGLLQDDIQVLTGAIRYLDKHRRK